MHTCDLGSEISWAHENLLVSHVRNNYFHNIDNDLIIRANFACAKHCLLKLRIGRSHF